MSRVDGTGQYPRRARLRTMLVLVWVVGGWASALLAAPRLRDWLVEYRSRTTGPSYGLANDAASAVAAELGTRDRAAELLGAPAAGLDEGKVCRLTWMDGEKTYVHARRPDRARPQTAWMAVTAADKVVLGRYAALLWSGNCAGQTEFYDRDCTKVAQIRLVERRELVVAKPRTDGEAPTPLLAGQCVWRTFTGEAEMVGWYRVWLPAEREITVRAFVLPPAAYLSYRLTHAGREAEHVRGENTVFQSTAAGDYELEVRLLAAGGEGKRPAGEYTVQVHWGQGAGEACPVPSFDERECYGVEIGERGGK